MKSSSQAKKTSKNVIKRSKFIHGLLANPRYSIFNWSFWTSLLLTIITLIFGGNTTAYIALNYLMRHSFDLVSMSVGAIGVILAAIAILVVIFSRQGLARIVAADEQTFEGFIFPYRLSATIWAILAVWSLFVPLLNNGLNISVKLAIAYVWLFLILYAMLYVLYLIGEIIQNILLSAEIESKK